jgi:hypothetical protein
MQESQDGIRETKLLSSEFRRVNTVLGDLKTTISGTPYMNETETISLLRARVSEGRCG